MMGDEPDILPNRIRELRKARGMTLGDLAPRAGLTIGHLGNLERGDRELTKPVMERLAAALGYEQADLLNVAEGGLTEEERRIIAIFREAEESGRSAIRAVADSQQPFHHFPDTTRKAG
jgi:transcriptional regulator with XRE-family HTH domain